VYSSRRGYALAITLAVAALAACGRGPAAGERQRIAILRFENMGADMAGDWMGRALSEMVTAQLAGAPEVYAIGSARLHAAEAVLGGRPATVPGVSAERALALAAGANRIGYGEYTVRDGRVEARLTIENPTTHQVERTIRAWGDLFDTASALARAIDGHAVPYATRNPAALRAWVDALETPDRALMVNRLEEAVAADPDFAPAWRRRAQLATALGDRAGALAVLDRALARGASLAPVERARLELDAAELRGDAAARYRSAASLARLDASEPAAWRALGESAMASRHYSEAAAAYGKAAALEPADVNSLNQRGYAEAYAGDLAAATAALGRYRKLRPNEANPIDSLGDVHLIAGGLREAEAFYIEAARKNSAFLAGGDWFKAAIARLMTGDVAGADGLAKQYIDARTAAGDPTADYRAAQWSWLAGRRKAALGQLERFARERESGPQRELASRAWAEAAVWRVALGDRTGASEAAHHAADTRGPASAAFAAMAAFLTQPPASPSEWAARAGLLPEGQLRDFSLAAALLLNRHFAAATGILEKLRAATAPAGDDAASIMLAWAYLMTGRAADAAPLLANNPIPQPGAVSPLTPFFFPRFWYLRGMEAEAGNRPADARAQYALFLRLSGPEPLAWGEEARARR
jgi:tetratricopeptide (TPR) repeat protein